LAGGEMAEAADLLLFVEPVGGHFHAAGRAQRVSFALSPYSTLEAYPHPGNLEAIGE
jgi:hypothetical protein